MRCLPMVVTLMVLLAGSVSTGCQSDRADRAGDPTALLSSLITACGVSWSIEPAVGLAPALQARVHARTQPCDVRNPSVHLALVRVEQRLLDVPTDRHTRDVAAARLITGSPSAALELLEPLLERPQVSNDDLALAGAACLLLGASGKNAGWWAVRALDLSERGLRDRAASLLPVFEFNRALALQQLGLIDDALSRWRETHDRHPRSGLGPATTARIRSLEQAQADSDRSRRTAALDGALASGDHGSLDRLVAVDPHVVREHFEEQLARWADAHRRRDTAAADAIRPRFEAMGARLEAVTDDRFPRDAAAAVARGTEAAQRDHARGLRLFFEAREQQAADALDAAERNFMEARGLLRAAASPYVLWVDVHLGVIAYQRGTLATALRIWTGIERTAEARNYRVVRGRARSLLSLVTFSQGSLGEALAHGRVALEAFSRTREQDFLAYIHNLIADHLRTLGAVRESWDHLREGLARFSVTRPVRQETLLLNASQVAMRDGLLYASLHFHDLWVQHADRAGTSLSRAEALLGRAALRHRLGDTSGAYTDVESAERWRAQIADPGLARLVEARRERTLAEIESGRRADRSIQHATRALDYYTTASRPRYVPGLLLTRGRALLAQGRHDEAERDLRAGITSFEDQRMRLPDVSVRVSFADASWDLYREMIAFQALHETRFDRAWVFAERARARVLREQLGGQAAPAVAAPAGPTDVARRLPAGVTLLHYTVLRRHLLIWRLTRDEARPILREMDMQELGRRLGMFTRRLRERSPEAEVRDDAAWLYDALVRPNPPPPGASLLVVVPDGPLHRVPFGALVNRTSSRYLLEEHGLVIAPNAGLYVRPAGSRPERVSSAPPRAVVVGSWLGSDPVSDLPALPGAAREADAIAALYPASVRLAGKDATKAAFVDHLRRSEVVHFAGHAIANLEHPDLSRLVLAPDRDGAGLLFAHELRALRMTHARLVVLAACSTGGGALSEGEGVLSLARPFLEAGVPSVVATLWDVGDQDAAGILPAFHAAWRRGDDAAEALRAAVLQSWQTGGPEARRPGRWAAFIVVSTGTVRRSNDTERDTSP
jgi:CHAT domain-containing protein/tetratricopeptide (TPR) repeat protein